MRRARGRSKHSFIFGFAGVAFTEPPYASEIIEVGLRCCARFSNYRFEVLRNGNFGGFDSDVIHAEAVDWNGGVS